MTCHGIGNTGIPDVWTAVLSPLPPTRPPSTDATQAQGPRVHSFHVHSKSPLLGCGLVLLTIIAGAVLAVLAGVAALFVGAGFALRRVWQGLFDRVAQPQAQEIHRPTDHSTVIDVEVVELESKRER